jgi:hypothetical protein
VEGVKQRRGGVKLGEKRKSQEKQGFGSVWGEMGWKKVEKKGMAGREMRGRVGAGRGVRGGGGGRKVAREVTGGQSEEKCGNTPKKWWKQSSDGAEKARGVQWGGHGHNARGVRRAVATMARMLMLSKSLSYVFRSLCWVVAQGAQPC